MDSEKTRPQLTIDLVVDITCPWCFLGFRALDWSVMALSFSHELCVRYRPFQPVSTSKSATTSVETAQAIEAGMRDVGVFFEIDGRESAPDTTDAFRLLRWAELEDSGKQVLSGLFEAYWIHAEDLSKREVLLQIAERAGMDGPETARRLESGEDKKAVEEEIQEFHSGGIQAVPTYIVNESAGFSGALSKSELLAALQQLAAECS